MAGGNSTRPRQRAARRWAVLSFSSLLTLGGGALACAEESTSLDVAFAVAADRDARPGERSIIVPGKSEATVDPDIELVTDQTDEPLEPIASVDEYEAETKPDLAEPPAGAEPDLADAPTIATDEASEEAVVDEFPDDGATAFAEDTAEEVAADDSSASTSTLQTASFNGVTPGVTTRARLLEQWGDPLDEDLTAKTLSFELKGFPQTVVEFNGEQVASIRVELPEAIAAEDLTAKLGLADFRPSKMVDEDGALVSTTYPERGVTYHHSADLGAMASDAGDIEPTPVDAVCEIVIQTVAAEAFIDRAHSCPEKDYAHRVADLETALELDPQNNDCRHWLSEVQLTVGELTAAEQLAAAAVKNEQANDEYRLQWAKCLTKLARYEEAVAQTRTILEGKTAPEIVRAAALEQMGQLAGLGSKEVQERAISLHNKAIELADKLAASDDVMLQAAAHRVLLDAHLAVAERISSGDWQQKEEFVGQWITRASGIAEQMIAASEADVAVRLEVAQTALLAGGRLSPPIDPKLWIAEAEQAATELTPTLGDETARDELNWQLGLAYFHAAEIQHRRGESELSVKYGEQAQGLLTPIAMDRAEYPDTAYLMGRLHFQIGAVHAVHRNDHKTACQWYDKASKPLLKPAPMTNLATPGHHGDALVSMGVSYWEIGQREKAYDLTKSGLELIEQGIDEGILANDATLVAEGNLSAMAQALGKVELETPAPKMNPAPQVAEGRRPAARGQANRSNGQSQQSVARRQSNEQNVRRR